MKGGKLDGTLAFDHLGRPKREALHMQTAFMWAERSLDPRRRVGAVVTTTDLCEILSFGYNGPCRGLPHDYIRDEPGNSGCLHAEDNAISRIRGPHENKVMFVTDEPCEMCSQRMVNAGFEKVYYCREYRDHTGIGILKRMGIQVIHMPMTGILEFSPYREKDSDV